MRNHSRLIIVSATLALASACAGTLADPDRFLTGDAGAEAATVATGDSGPAATCPDIPSAVLVPSCGTAGCHTTSNPAGTLDLVSPGLAARLVGVPATGGGLLVDSANPEQSVLYLRLVGTSAGARMPSAASPLSDATDACVLSWIKGLSTSPPPTTDGGLVDASSDGTTATDGGGTIVRVAAGQAQDYKDSQGNVWKADFGAAGGVQSTNNPAIAIGKTQDTALYNSERYGNSAAFSYVFPVANGNYEVTLKFAETFTAITAAGQRTFNVSINGTSVLTNFDIFATGGANTAVDQTFPETVTGGSITIQFDLGTAQNPKVDAISILPK